MIHTPVGLSFDMYQTPMARRFLPMALLGAGQRLAGSRQSLQKKSF
jgi:hypothetical protein